MGVFRRVYTLGLSCTRKNAKARWNFTFFGWVLQKKSKSTVKFFSMKKFLDDFSFKWIKNRGSESHVLNGRKKNDYKMLYWSSNDTLNDTLTYINKKWPYFDRGTHGGVHQKFFFSIFIPSSEDDPPPTLAATLEREIFSQNFFCFQIK